MGLGTGGQWCDAAKRGDAAPGPAPRTRLACGRQRRALAFLAPCPPALAEAAPEICRDAPGFDRVAFHQGFNAKVVGFFQQHLAAGKAP
ncbi:hypothetical protein ACINB_13700 [Acidovorax sp. NB1]|nr:hypothetical protein ACINB_13700 [Acidovorax sp. NB1]